MKYIKEYSEHLSYELNQFTPEDIEELQDVYQDIVDDLGLYDSPFQIHKVDDSSFQLPKKYEGKMCKIFIRTIVTELWHFGEMKDVTKEELEYNKEKLEQLEPHIERIKRMGYEVEVKDLKKGPEKDFVVNGIVLEITKKPHQ